MPEPTDRERIENLEAAGHVQDVRLEKLEAAGLVLDERTVALAKEIDDLHAKIESRGVIDQAKGVIMSALGCGPDAAFAVLVAQSQAENRKVRDIATEIAHSQNRKPG
jgi:AmiR/NasT family two-component response regulator